MAQYQHYQIGKVDVRRGGGAIEVYNGEDFVVRVLFRRPDDGAIVHRTVCGPHCGVSTTGGWANEEVVIEDVRSEGERLRAAVLDARKGG